MSKKPLWCTKPSPCDYDKGSAYCPHRECRQRLEKLMDECNTECMVLAGQLIEIRAAWDELKQHSVEAKRYLNKRPV